MSKGASFSLRIGLIFFGLFLTVIILEVGLRFGGFAILTVQEYKNQQSIRKKGVYRIMCLGESTTQEQYPPFLEEKLNQSETGIKFSVIDRGKVGTRTEVILSELEANLDKYKPDMVIAMMGVNDNGRHMPVEEASFLKKDMIWRSLKIYKLVKFLWLRLETKYEEAGLFFRAEGQFKNMHESSRHQRKAALQKTLNGDSGYEAASQTRSDNYGSGLDPHNFSYAQMGQFRSDKKSFADFEQWGKKAIELKPDDDSLYMQLGWLYDDHLDFVKAEHAYRKAMELNPLNEIVRVNLGQVYVQQGRYAEAEQCFKETLELNSDNSSALDALGNLYGFQGRFYEAEPLFKRAIKLEPDNWWLCGRLALVYSAMGGRKRFNLYTEKANGLRNRIYDPVTINNYQRLKRALDRRKIHLVCVQYPMRNVSPLEDIFKEDGGADVVFVDNEKIFKDAVEREGYKAYFRDMFAGNFGHCTDNGNRLLAENIADVILREVFKKAARGGSS